MKKIMSVLMAAAVLISMTACAPKKTPQEIYSEAMTKYAALTMQDMSAKIDMSMAAMGEKATPDMSMNIGMDTNIKLLKTGDKYEIQMYADTSIFGQKTNIRYYFVDDYMYMDAMGQKIKIQVPIDEMQEQMKSSQAQVIPFEYMDQFEMVEDKESGNRTFKFTVLKDKMNEYMEDALGAMGQTNIPDDVKMDMGEMSGEVVINKNGDIISQKNIMNFTMDMQGISMNISMNTDSVMNNIGQPVTIVPPADLDEYMEAPTAESPVAPVGPQDPPAVAAIPSI